MKPFKYLLSFLVIVIFSCNNSNNYYEQITKHKSEKELVQSINQSFEKINKSENNKFKTKEDVDYLAYEYPLGKEEDSYVISYHFDEKGCYEVGIDTYISKIGNTNIIVNGFENYFNNDGNFNPPKSDNNLLRWESKDNQKAVELDFRNADKGMVILTIFAYE